MNERTESSTLPGVDETVTEATRRDCTEEFVGQTSRGVADEGGSFPDANPERTARLLFDGLDGGAEA